eukprot:8371844-Alexandrium_andersonii.AAC.1
MRWRARWPRKPERGICPRFAGPLKTGYFATVRRAWHRCLVRCRARGPAQGGVAIPAGAAGAGHAHPRGDDGRGVRCRGRRRAQG